MSRIADTSLLIAAFDERDPRRPQALRALEEPDTIHVPPEVIGETLGVVERRRGAEVARRLLRALRGLPHVIFLRSSSPQRIEAIFNDNRKLSWVDATVADWCRQLGATPLCFDPEIDAELKA